MKTETVTYDVSVRPWGGMAVERLKDLGFKDANSNSYDNVSFTYTTNEPSNVAYKKLRKMIEEYNEIGSIVMFEKQIIKSAFGSDTVNIAERIIDNIGNYISPSNRYLTHSDVEGYSDNEITPGDASDILTELNWKLIDIRDILEKAIDDDDITDTDELDGLREAIDEADSFAKDMLRAESYNSLAMDIFHPIIRNFNVIKNSRKISSSQKGMENVAEGTKYDDYYIDTTGMGINHVGDIVGVIEDRGNQAVLTIQCSDGTVQHSYFTLKDWKNYKDSKNAQGVAVTDVWVTEVEGGSYVRNSRQIKSERIVCINPETGKRFTGNFDGNDIKITQVPTNNSDVEVGDVYSWSEILNMGYMDDKEHMNRETYKYNNSRQIKSSRKISSAVDGGWEVDSSDVPEALDLFVEYYGEEYALESIAKAMSSDTLEENIDWIARQWGFGEDLEDIESAWDKYENAKEIMGVSELFNNLTQAAGYDELAEDLAFIFRMEDFRQWDKYDNDDEDDEIDEDGKQQAIFNLLVDMYSSISKYKDWLEYYRSEDKDKDFKKAHEVNDMLDEYYNYSEPLLEEYEEQGGTYSINDNDSSDGDFDDVELATRIFETAIQRIKEYEDSEEAEDLTFDEWLAEHYPSKKITSSRKPVKSARYIATDPESGEVLGSADTYEEAVNEWGEDVTITDSEVAEGKENMDTGLFSSKKSETTKQTITRLLSSVISGEMTEDEAAEEIAQANNINIGYAKQIFSEYMNDKERYLTSGMLELGEALNVDFDPDGNLDTWYVDFAGEEDKPAPTLGGELVKAARYIIRAFRENGEKIGWGYAMETLNPAARFIIDNTDFGGNDELKSMIEGDVPDDNGYERWVNNFEEDFANYLRDHSELFEKLNKTSFMDAATESDEYTSVDEFFVEDDEGNQYWFQSDSNGWTCVDISYDTTPEYNEGDVITAEDYMFDNIDFNEEFGEFTEAPFEYSWEDGDGESVRISNVRLMNGLYEIDDYISNDELMELVDGTVYDRDGNQLKAKDIF